MAVPHCLLPTVERKMSFRATWQDELQEQGDITEGCGSTHDISHTCQPQDSLQG